MLLPVPQSLFLLSFVRRLSLTTKVTLRSKYWTQVDLGKVFRVGPKIEALFLGRLYTCKDP